MKTKNLQITNEKIVHIAEELRVSLIENKEMSKMRNELASLTGMINKVTFSLINVFIKKK